MARALRYDTHRLDGVETLPSGALRVPARVAKVGVLDYDDGQGNTWGELVPESTLFAADSMSTLRAVACTDLHPGAPVTPLTRKGLQVGHVSDVIARDGDYLATTVYVTDADEIARVQSGERKDVSCGYECELDETPGTFNGKPYARVQRDRVYNHLGIGPEGWGRAGTDVSLRLDGSDSPAGESAARIPVARLDSGDSQTARPAAQTPLPGAQKTSTDSRTTGSAAPITAPAKGTRSAMAQPKTTKKDGDEPTPMDPKKDEPKKDAEGDEMVPKKDADQEAAKHTAMIASLKALLAEATKRIAELEAGESAEITEEDVPESVADSIVVKRLAKVDAARVEAKIVAPAVVLETKMDGASVATPILKIRAIHEAALKIAAPTFKCDGRTDDAVAGAFAVALDAARARQVKRADGARRGSEVLTPSHEQAEEIARQEKEDGASFDPIEAQRKALNDWGKRPNGNTNTSQKGA